MKNNTAVPAQFGPKQMEICAADAPVQDRLELMDGTENRDKPALPAAADPTEDEHAKAQAAYADYDERRPQMEARAQAIMDRIHADTKMYTLTNDEIGESLLDQIFPNRHPCEHGWQTPEDPDRSFEQNLAVVLESVTGGLHWTIYRTAKEAQDFEDAQLDGVVPRTVEAFTPREILTRLDEAWKAHKDR